MNRNPSAAPPAVAGSAEAGRLTNHSRTAWTKMHTMPAVANQPNSCKTISSPPPQTDDGGEDGKREHREGVQSEDRAHDGQHDRGYGEHDHPLTTAQALTN